MTASIQPLPLSSRRSLARSVGAVAAAFVAMALVTLAADQVLHSLGVFPPWGQISYDAGPYALAVAYRALFGVGGSWLAARLAPREPMKHAIGLGIVGLVFSALGVVAALTHDLGPVWYPITLLAIAYPAAWLGGRLYTRRQTVVEV